ncbi:RNA-directed DNA polymerase from mobile element jockey [Araneus ventricosus]|uniref:RNA-directed DNA polymerase from mobile element jockey n=1 Tax=Araneus ventricosus TaxID=182803 RepID=A0A4Y2PR27_ARAVE|nr:RNA-directed DNA polymerase from mobile element jockey [Araneus ventricosus]
MYVEATVVVINFKNLDKITLTSIYIPPMSDNALFTFDLENLIQISPHQIICGDFNAHHTSWNCSSNTPRGNTLHSFATQVGLEILFPNSPTRYGFNSATTIDLAIVRDFLFPYDINSLPEMSSDHNPVILTFYLRYTLPDCSGNTQILWKKLVNSLAHDFNCSILNINTPDALDKLTENFENFILNSVQKNTTKQKINKPNSNEKIGQLSNQRNLARKMYQTTRNPVYKTNMNRLNKQIKKLNYSIEQNSLNNKLINISTFDNSLWKFVKPFQKKHKNIPALCGLHNIALTDNDKANCLALETQFTLNELHHQETEMLVKNSVEGLRNTIPTRCTNKDLPLPSEIISHIKKLKNNKAPGADNISNKIIKNFPPNITIILTFIIQRILLIGHFPTRWKTAVVIPILKPGMDPTLPASYRPISLLSSLSKIAEQVILTRFNDHLNENNLLCPEQFGFRPNLSTTHQLVRVTEYITEGFTKKQKTGAVFLDIQKAFDRVWKDGLIHKLITLNTPQYLVKIFDSYLTNRSFRVRVKDELSEQKIIQAGVAQGSKLGPVLFSCYINDIPKQFNTLLCMYADDTAILAQNKNPNYIQLALNRHLATIEDWFHKWKIAINAGKTEAVMFCKNIKNLNFPQLKINNIQIPWSQECKYLGVILDRKLTWKPHFLYTKKKFRNAARKFYPLISRNSKMHRDNKMLIYTAYLRPILTYAAPVWGYAAKSNIKILESQQNIVIAQICHATWYMRATDVRKALNFPSFKEFIKKLAINFYKSFDNSDNEAIKCIHNYKPDIKIKRPRNILIS